MVAPESSQVNTRLQSRVDAQDEKIGNLSDQMHELTAFVHSMKEILNELPKSFEKMMGGYQKHQGKCSQPYVDVKNPSMTDEFDYVATHGLDSFVKHNHFDESLFSMPKVKLHVFEGTDPRGWITKAELNFQDQLRTKLMTRFSGTKYRNAHEALGSLYQEGDIEEYIEDFEALSALIPNQSKEQSIGMFLRVVATAEKSDHMGKINSVGGSSQAHSWKHSQHDSSPHTGRFTQSSYISPHSSKPVLSSEWEDRRRNGLYFSCGQKYSPQHKYTKGQLRVLLLAKGEELGDDGEICRVETDLEDNVDIDGALGIEITTTKKLGIRLGDGTRPGWALWGTSFTIGRLNICDSGIREDSSSCKGSLQLFLITLPCSHAPQGLPPARTIKHVIHLYEGQGPICVRLYRYPHMHKDEIERQVWEMLDAGIIRASQSAYSSQAVKGFLGLTGYYQKFINGYGKISRPLTELTKKDSFHWGPLTQSAFEELKQTMVNAPVLAFPNFSQPFEIECDALGSGIGAVLMQSKRPIAYFSKALSDMNLNKSAYEKEIMALVLVIQHWRPYLLGRNFTVFTNQKSLKHLLEQCITTMDQQNWIAKLMGYQFSICYKPGKENRAADALSRIYEGTELRTMISYPQWLDEGKLYHKGRLVISASSPWIPKLLVEFHNSPSGGHSGFYRMYRRLASRIYWLGMTKAVKEYVRACDVCQRYKASTVTPGGLLQPLPIPNLVWEDISLDFITGLPKSKGYDAVLVVVDRLSKYCHFVPLKHPLIARTLAEIFLREIIHLHGILKFVLSDRDPLFLSRFWQEIFSLQGSKYKFSSAYHPETDGQTEVVNRSLETYLRCFAAEQPKTCSRSPLPDEALKQLKYHLARAQAQMKSTADKHRRDVEFAMGDWVFLKLRPHRQQSVVRRINQKLSARYYRPFLILAKIGSVAYKLQLPESYKIHPVFHVSLKQAIGNHSAEASLPLQWLIQWQKGSVEDATWEDAYTIRSQFLDFRLEDNLLIFMGPTLIGKILLMFMSNL
ncbi:retrotransposon-related protein [Tanacetum coccineum]